MNSKERSIAPLTGVVRPQNVETEKEKVQVTVNLVPGGYPMLVFLIFLVLKLTGEISWSWVWVTSPLWIVIVLSLITAVILALNKDKENS